MNREEIMNVLPHRQDMLLLDEAQAAGDNQAQGVYRVRGDEFFLRGHFPGNPVVPGVILLEIMAQTACALPGLQVAGKTPYYAGLDKVRFRRMVRPGETVKATVTLLRGKMNVYVAAGEVRVDGELAVSGEMTFTIR